MQTVKVILQGVLAKEFLPEWELAINTPAEAIRLIDANDSKFLPWIQSHLTEYEFYKVIATFHDGRTEELGEDDLLMHMKIKELHIVPLINGSGAIGRIIGGVVLMIIGLFVYPLFAVGLMLVVGGVTQLLSPVPDLKKKDGEFDRRSSYFDGPRNTTTQGSPVPMIYGRVLTGAQPISINYTVEQID